MESNSEIRGRAWLLLWREKWFWKLLGGTVLLNVCAQVISSALNGALHRLGVFGMGALAGALEDYAKNRAPLPELTPDLAVQFATSTALVLFFAFIMGGISAYGRSALLLRAADGNGAGWLKAAFGGFKMPLGLAWLSFRACLIYTGWSVVAFVPASAVVWLARVASPPAALALPAYALAGTLACGLAAAVLCVPFYRYRYLFRVKADHPDWGAGRCLRECAALSRGFKWRCFVHDCSYWRALLAPLLLLLLCVAAVCAVSCARFWCPQGLRDAVVATGALLCVAMYLAVVAMAVVVGFYVGVGQTLLYRDVAREGEVRT